VLLWTVLMGLLSAGPVFTQEWVDGLKAIPAKFMPCTIRIYRQTVAPVWNPEITGYSPAVEEDLYVGAARVTPRRGALNKPLRENPTVTQTVQFQIPIDGYDFDLRNDCIVQVISSPLNEVLTDYSYRVHEVVDSGNPIEYTFWCIVDQEVVLDG
jgi:hypothetical protein